MNLKYDANGDLRLWNYVIHFGKNCLGREINRSYNLRELSEAKKIIENFGIKFNSIEKILYSQGHYTINIPENKSKVTGITVIAYLGTRRDAIAEREVSR